MFIYLGGVPGVGKTTLSGDVNIKENIRNLMIYKGMIADYYCRTLSEVFNKLCPTNSQGFAVCPARKPQCYLLGYHTCA